MGRTAAGLAGADPDGLTVPSGPTTALFAALSGTAPPTDGPGSGWPAADEDVFEHPGALPRLAALYRVVLPRLVTSYERHLRVASATTDGPVARALRLVLNDEIEDWQAGERPGGAAGQPAPRRGRGLRLPPAAGIGRWWEPGPAPGLVAIPGPVPGD